MEISNYKIVSEYLDILNIEYVLGRTWTTDAFYRETKGNFLKRKLEGCIAVEMEVSACQAVANFRGYQLYNFYIVLIILIHLNGIKEFYLILKLMKD